MKFNIPEIEKEIEKGELRILKLKRENRIAKARPSSVENIRKRKKRAHDLILRGSLFETVGLIGEAPEALLGFLMENIAEYQKNKDKYFAVGYVELKSRKIIRSEVTRMISNDEISLLLGISMDLKDKNIDVGVVMQEKFKKKLFQDLTYQEFEFFRELGSV